MSTEENKVVVRQFVEDVQNQANLERLEELAASAFVNHTAPPGLPPGREGMRLVDGKVVEHWNVVDMLGMLQQIGAIPAPGQPNA